MEPSPNAVRACVDKLTAPIAFRSIRESASRRWDRRSCPGDVRAPDFRSVFDLRVAGAKAAAVCGVPWRPLSHFALADFRAGRWTFFCTSADRRGGEEEAFEALSVGCEIVVVAQHRGTTPAAPLVGAVATRPPAAFPRSRQSRQALTQVHRAFGGNTVFLRRSGDLARRFLQPARQRCRQWRGHWSSCRTWCLLAAHEILRGGPVQRGSLSMSSACVRVPPAALRRSSAMVSNGWGTQDSTRAGCRRLHRCPPQNRRRSIHLSFCNGCVGRIEGPEAHPVQVDRQWVKRRD